MLKLQYFGHLMGRDDSLEKTLTLGKIEGRRTIWMDGITDSVDMSLNKFWEMVMTRKPGVLQSIGSQRVNRTEQLNNDNIRQLCGILLYTTLLMSSFYLSSASLDIFLYTTFYRRFSCRAKLSIYKEHPDTPPPTYMYSLPPIKIHTRAVHLLQLVYTDTPPGPQFTLASM